jgi:hypothetical protein
MEGVMSNAANVNGNEYVMDSSRVFDDTAKVFDYSSKSDPKKHSENQVA